MIIENCKRKMTTFTEFVCRSVEFRTWEFGIVCEEYLTRQYVESLILQRISVYDVAYHPMC
jgi:hypothetical protein